MRWLYKTQQIGLAKEQLEYNCGSSTCQLIRDGCDRVRDVLCPGAPLHPHGFRLRRFGFTNGGQSRVSDLVRGRWDKFSQEMLITLETRAGRWVTLELAA